MLLVDALREDFVEFDTKAHQYLDPKNPFIYSGRKLKLFKEAVETFPERAVLFPFSSEIPTVTAVRVKSMLTGGVATSFDVTSEFGSSENKEDNILYQLKNRKGKVPTIAQYGDRVWPDQFGQFFDRHEWYDATNVRDLESFDLGSTSALYKELEESDFSLLIGHVLGVDSAGHAFHSGHPEIERKLRDAEEVIHQVIEKMDEKTTLLVFGDHGMTGDGTMAVVPNWN